MSYDLLDEIIAKNSASARPNNKVNTSVVVDESTLQLAECIASHSESSVSKVLSSFLDEMNFNFIHAYRNMIPEKDRVAFDKMLIDKIGFPFAVDLFDFNKDEMLTYCNFISIYKDNYEGTYRVERIGDNLVLSGFNLKGKAVEVALSVEKLNVEGDGDYEGINFALEHAVPCAEDNISASFGTATHVEINGVICWINEESLVNTYPALSISNYLVNKGIVSKKEISLDIDCLIEKNGSTFVDLKDKKEWKQIDSENGVWEYKGNEFKFFTAIDVYAEDEDE